MEVLEQGEKIVFLRKLKEGPTAESYGIHVARLAGLSQDVLSRADQIMGLLRQRDVDLTDTFGGNIIVNHEKTKVNESIVEKSVISPAENMLNEIDTEQITPLEALNLLCQLKKLTGSGEKGEGKREEGAVSSEQGARSREQGAVNREQVVGKREKGEGSNEEGEVSKEQVVGKREKGGGKTVKKRVEDSEPSLFD